MYSPLICVYRTKPFNTPAPQTKILCKITLTTDSNQNVQYVVVIKNDIGLHGGEGIGQGGRNESIELNCMVPNCVITSEQQRAWHTIAHRS